MLYQKTKTKIYFNKKFKRPINILYNIWQKNPLSYLLFIIIIKNLV